MVDGFVTHHTARIRWREVARDAMPVQRLRPTAPVRYGFRVLMALDARVFFVANRATGPIPLRFDPVRLPTPRNRVVLRRFPLMAIVAERLQFMAHRAVGRIDLRFAAVDRFPNLRRIMLNPHPRTVRGDDVRIQFGMAR